MNLDRARKSWTGDDEEPDGYPYAVSTDFLPNGDIMSLDSSGRSWVTHDGGLNWKLMNSAMALARQAVLLFPHSYRIPRTQTNRLRRQWIAARLYLGDRALVLHRVERKVPSPNYRDIMLDAAKVLEGMARKAETYAKKEELLEDAKRLRLLAETAE